jgi:phosphoglycerate dehydrogenase-like enzyme
MRRIIINRNIFPDNLSYLKRAYPQFEFLMEENGRLPSDELIGSAEIIFGWVDADLLAMAESLRWFHSLSAGVDTYIDEIDRLFGIKLLVSNSAGVYGVPISEHLLAMMLGLVRRIGESVRNMPQGAWGGVTPCAELSGSTVGIVGFGDIGRHLAGLLVPFRCEVLAFKRSPVSKPKGVSEMLYGEEGLDELLRRCDHVCVCLPGTPATRGLIDSRRIGLMKHSACLYNIGRGTIVDHAALAQALVAGHLGGAGLDVTDPEPLPQDNPLWGLGNVIITPHMSGYTPVLWEKRMTEFFARNLDAYLEGRPLPGAVDRVNKY